MPHHPDQTQQLLESAKHPHLTSYPKFLLKAISLSTNGGLAYYTWMIFLTSIALVGVNAWAHQFSDGMIITNMTDHVSWGLYIANFTFIVGLAAGGVMMVIPAYLYHDKEMHNVVLVGELLAVAAIIMCLLFVTVDMGRPDRFWHIVPGIGRFNFPISMLTWDVLVLNGYLLINMHICGYLLYTRYQGRTPNPKFYLPIVFLSILWAFSIHTVTAFLYSGLGGRPFWNSALLAPRFLTSAFVAGPAFIIITMHLIRKLTNMKISMSAIQTLKQIVRVTICINILMIVSEIFTEFYTGGAHTASAKYLFFGLDGKTALVPWIWTAIACNFIAAFLFIAPKTSSQNKYVILACVIAFVGIWIEKGMGLIIPGFIPSTMHEIVEYLPSMTEWKISAGIWAFGLLIYTASLKVAIPIIKGQAHNISLPITSPATPANQQDTKK